jgi:predicted nucleotidyltransferase
MTKNEILNYLKNHKDELSKSYLIEKLALFGSFARDDAKSSSDVDIAIKTPLADYFELYNLKERLQNAFGRGVDIIRLRDKMNPALKKRIEKEAIYV